MEQGQDEEVEFYVQNRPPGWTRRTSTIDDFLTEYYGEVMAWLDEHPEHSRLTLKGACVLMQAERETDEPNSS